METVVQEKEQPVKYVSAECEFIPNVPMQLMT